MHWKADVISSLLKMFIFVFVQVEYQIQKVKKMRSDFWSGLMGNSKGGQGGLTEASLNPYRVFGIKSGTICLCKIVWEALFQNPTFQYIEQGEIINRVELWVKRQDDYWLIN